MVLQTNISALNANRQLNIVRKTGSKSAEKLSSGYRINRAADDAAGLGISEKMRRQIRGLSRAGENVEDGISLCQVADGAMAEMQDMTNRMNELCVQAANGTNSAADRSYIQMEIDSIVTEFDRIINTTKFNEVYVFKGDAEYAPTITDIWGSSKDGIGSVPGIKAWGEELVSDRIPDDYLNNKAKWVTTKTPDGTDADINGSDSCAWVDFTNFKANSKDEFIKKLDGQGFDSTCSWGCKAYYGIKFVAQGERANVTPSGIPYSYSFSFPNTSEVSKSEVVKINLDDLWNRYEDSNENRALGEVICATLMDVINDAGKNMAGSQLTNHATSYVYKKGTGKFYVVAKQGGDAPKFHGVPRDANGNLELKVIGTRVIMPKKQLGIHAGTDTDLVNKVIMQMPTMSKESLRLDKVSVLKEAFATDSISILSDTLRFLSEDRSRIGAYQNRLEHTSLNLDNIVENTTDSESQIRDTDMAEEMVRYSNNNILTQAGQSMLSQANASRQNILSLLGA